MIGFAAKLLAKMAWRKVTAPFRREKEVEMQPKEILSVWDVTYKTGTGISSWIAAVAFIALAIVFAFQGVLGWGEVGIFVFGVVTWAIQQIRGRWATAKLQNSVTTLINGGGTVPK